MYPIEFVMVLFEQQILQNWKSLQSLQSNVAKPQLGALKLLLHFSCKEQPEWLDLIQMWGQNFNLLFRLLKELVFCSSSKMGPTVWALVRANFPWDLWNWLSFGQELCTMYSPNILPSNPLPLAGSIQLAGIMPLSPCGRRRDLEYECVGDRPQLPFNMNCSSEDCSTPPENAFSSPMLSSLWWVAPKSRLLNCCCWYS